MAIQIPVVPPHPQATLHLKILGWMHVIFGAVSCIAALVAALALYGNVQLFPQETKDLLIQSGYATSLLWLFLGLSVLTVITGIGLLQQAQWARKILWVFAIISLFDIPLGTMFGLYAIWTLTRKGSALSY